MTKTPRISRMDRTGPASFNVTILRSHHGKLLTKRFRVGGATAYDKERLFQHTARPVSDVGDLARLIEELQNDRHAMVVAGRVREEFRQTTPISRRLHARDDQPATIEDHPTPLLHFDVDDLQLPDGLDWSDPESAAAWAWGQLATRLPILKGTSVVWQASSSAGLPGKERLAKFHFWAIADRPLNAAERKRIYSAAGSDTALASAVQPNYTATPVFDGIPDPLAGRPRVGQLDGEHDRVCVGECLSEPRPDRARRPRTRASRTPARPANPAPATTCTQTTDHGRALLKKYRAEILRATERNTTINRAAYTIGGLVAGGEITEADALDMLHKAGRDSGHERYEEAIQNGFSAGLQRPIRRTNTAEAVAKDRTVAPFFPAPALPRSEAIEGHRQTIQTWFARALSHARARKDPLSTDDTGSQPPRFLLRGAQGIGKTSLLVGRSGKPGLLHRAGGLVTAMFLPDHGKCQEAFDDYQGAACADAPEALVLRGRGIIDPDSIDLDSGSRDQMCQANKLAQQLFRHGVSVRKTLCPRCPFAQNCGYLRQERRIQDLISAGNGLVLFAPHDYAFLPLPGEAQPDLVIFDERPRDFGTTEVGVSRADLEFSLSTEANPYLRSATRKKEEQAANDDVQFHAIAGVKHALLKACEEDGTVSLATLRAAGITGDRIDQAIEDLGSYCSRTIPHRVKQALPATEGALPPDEARQTLAKLAQEIGEHAQGPAIRLKALFEAVRLEIDSDRGVLTGVIARRAPARKGAGLDGLQAFALRPLLQGSGVPFLYLDGTADPALARVLFGDDLQDHHFPVERNAEVIQIVGCNFAKRRLCDLGPTDEKLAEDNKKLLQRVTRLIDQHPDAAVFANKSVIKALGLSKDPRAGHFGALRGRNAWQARNMAIVVGREQPAPQDIERIARAYAAAAGNGFTSGAYCKAMRGIRTRKGAHPIEVETHPDPWAQRILHQIREAEIEQAIDRLRLIHNPLPKRVLLMTPVAINVTVDRVIPWRRLWDENTRIDPVIDWRDVHSGNPCIDRAISEHKILIPSPAGCVKWMPEIWANRTTPSRHLKELDLGELDAPYERVVFRPIAEPGEKPHRAEALVFAKGAAARKIVERLVGDLAEFKILQNGPKPPRAA